MDLTTVADDLVVLHEPGQVHRFEDLSPDSEFTLLGHQLRTLPRPPGERLATFATVNDVHFGETTCGLVDGGSVGPVFSSALGERPYPEVMNAAAITEIAAINPDAVVAKGDLTADGTDAEYATFLAHYGAFGERLHHVRGNHDAYHGQTHAAGDQRVDLPGVTLAIIDTAIPLHTTGRITGEQLDWLDTLCAEADQAVLVFGHHNLWLPDSERSPDYFGINPDDSEGLLALATRRRRFSGYFAGHTHRNRVRHYGPTGNVPYAEVACVKDFPGSWAEYRVFEGGIEQVHHRISSPEALAWSDQTRSIYAEVLDYGQYALGRLEDRCFLIDTNR